MSPEREGEVDEREHVVYALRLLLRATRRQHERTLRTAEETRHAQELRFRDAGDLLGALGPVRRDHAAQLLEPFRALGDERLVDRTVAQEEVQQPVRER